MYLVIIIIINFEEDIKRSFQELRLDFNSPELELELELKCLELELELELKLIVSSGIGIGIGIENNGIGIGIELKKRNWPQPCSLYRGPVMYMMMMRFSWYSIIMHPFMGKFGTPHRANVYATWAGSLLTFPPWNCDIWNNLSMYMYQYIHICIHINQRSWHHYPKCQHPINKDWVVISVITLGTDFSINRLIHTVTILVNIFPLRKSLIH